MDPATLALALSILELAIKEEPAVQADITALFAKPDPTPADWQALRAKRAGQTYASLVPDSKLPAQD